MDDKAPIFPDSADGVSVLDALVSPSLDPMFWRAERLGVASAWWQHVPFGHWVVRATKPRLLVELGTHAGVSYSALCQAVARSDLDTRCYAVDTWRGDPQAGLYGEEVFEEFRRFHDERYSAFSTLLHTTFDEALAQFASGTVDLLHIDGLHTYEAVRHDFESWSPKLSERAVVLLHDTNERRDDFGVWRLWAELCEQFPHFEFLHGHGLGVLAPSKNVDPNILALCHLSEPSSVAAVRNRFAALGERCLIQTHEQMLAQDLGLLAIGEHAELLRERIATSAAQTEQTRILAEQTEQARRDAEAKAEQAEGDATRAEANAAQAEQTRREAEVRAAASEARAQEIERAREQIAARIIAARRDVYNANMRAEQCEAKAREAGTKAVQAETMISRVMAQAELAQIERDQAQRARDALLLSTAWQVTWPLRVAGHKLPPSVRRALRRGAELGWWSLTLKLPSKLRDRRAALALGSGLAAAPLEPQPDASAPQSESQQKAPRIEPRRSRGCHITSPEQSAPTTLEPERTRHSRDSMPRTSATLQPISVVIPTYNRADLLEETLRRCTDHSGPVEIEFIVIDDGSTDDTAIVLSRLENEIPNLTWRRILNGGPGKARNLGASIAKYPVVLFLGDDIRPVDENFFSVHARLHALNTSRSFAVLGKIVWPEADTAEVNFVMSHIQGRGGEQFGYAHFTPFTYLDWRFFYTSNISVKTSIVADWMTDGFQPQFIFAAFEDGEFAYRLQKGPDPLQIYYDPTSVGCHIHPYTLDGFLTRQMNVGMMAKPFIDLHPEVAEPLGLSPLLRALCSPEDTRREKLTADYLSIVEGIKSWARIIESSAALGREWWHEDLLSAVFELAFLQGFLLMQAESSSNFAAGYDYILKRCLQRLRKLIHHELTGHEFLQNRLVVAAPGD
jgi:glycosyltransferase involved in cell wall biosynthesis